MTKGRILSDEGKASPQVDVLVLHPSYPVALRDKKLYFAGGVVAAFECKLTLRKEHIKKAKRNAAIIKNLLPQRIGNPYDELHQPIIFGVLAHSHSWTTTNIWTPFDICLQPGETVSNKYNHPRYMIDVVCISDLATFVLDTEIFMGPLLDEERLSAFGDDPLGGVNTVYGATWELNEEVFGKGMILARLITALSTRMAYEDPALRPFVDYLSRTAGKGSAGTITKWPPSIFSEGVAQRLIKEGTQDEEWWGKWQYRF